MFWLSLGYAIMKSKENQLEDNCNKTIDRPANAPEDDKHFILHMSICVLFLIIFTFLMFLPCIFPELFK
jgi:hypothetical protein